MGELKPLRNIWMKRGSKTPSKGVGHVAANAAVPPAGEDTQVARANLVLRGLQVFFAAVTLLIAVWMATFQSKWTGSPSGLTGLLLFLASASLLTSSIFLIVPIIFERSGYKTMKGFTRSLAEARVGLVTNGFFTLILLFVSAAQTISAYTSAGCKNPENDPHAGVIDDKKAFVKALDGWCRTKRAEAAFCWFLWVTWSLSLLMFVRQWRLERKNGPRIPPFSHPNDNSAFEPIDDLEDDDVYDEIANKSRNYGEGGDGNHTPASAPMPSSYDRRGTNPLADIEARYGMKPSYSMDPFADRPVSAVPQYEPSPIGYGLPGDR